MQSASYKPTDYSVNFWIKSPHDLLMVRIFDQQKTH